MQSPVTINSLSQSEADQMKVIFEGQGATVVVTPAGDGTFTLVATYGATSGGTGSDDAEGLGSSPSSDNPPPGGAFASNASDFKTTVVSNAEAEWTFFGNQQYDVNGHLTVVGHQESQDGYYQRIGEYWLTGTGLHGVDGRVTGMPWSAAFISWLMVTSGAGTRFRTSRMHSVYVDQAIRDRLSGRAEAGYWGWRLNEVTPSAGDIVCWGREPGVDYDHQKQGNYSGHCDLVVAVERDKIWIIGGNVGNSVTKRPLSLDAAGFLVPTVVNEENLFAIMQCHIDNSIIDPPLAVVVPNAPVSPSVVGDTQIAWGSVLGPALKQKVIDVAHTLQCDPSHLTAAMAFETGETFSPSERNRLSGATGLIQFMPATAQGLGTSTTELAAMTALRQMDFVAKYFSPYSGRLAGLSDVYKAILWPAAVGFPDSRTLFARGTIQYTQNQGLDVNSDGIVTKGEATSKVQAKLAKGLGSGLIG